MDMMEGGIVVNKELIKFDKTGKMVGIAIARINHLNSQEKIGKISGGK